MEGHRWSKMPTVVGIIPKSSPCGWLAAEFAEEQLIEQKSNLAPEDPQKGARSGIKTSSAMKSNPAPTMPKPSNETLNRWHKHLSLGEPILGPIAAFPPEDQTFFASMGVRSVMMFPIISGKRFYGFLSLKDKKNHRERRNEERVAYGDATHPAILEHAGVERSSLALGVRVSNNVDVADLR